VYVLSLVGGSCEAEESHLSRTVLSEEVYNLSGDLFIVYWKTLFIYIHILSENAACFEL
jgi:hypothetical protein